MIAPMKIRPPGKRTVLTHLCAWFDEVGQALHAMYSRLDQMQYDVCFLGHGSRAGMVAKVSQPGAPQEQEVVPMFFVTAIGLGRQHSYQQGTEKASRGGQLNQ